ncbi:MAG: hypothetical protein V8S96_03770 [Lachnospiraceae bacterium]
MHKQAQYPVPTFTLLPVGTVFQVLIPVALGLGLGIGLFGGAFSIRKHLRASEGRPEHDRRTESQNKKQPEATELRTEAFLQMEVPELSQPGDLCGTDRGIGVWHGADGAGIR